MYPMGARPGKGTYIIAALLSGSALPITAVKSFSPWLWNSSVVGKKCSQHYYTFVVIPTLRINHL